MRAIMYHYVREYYDKMPAIRYLDFSNFCRQLDFFGTQYGFVEKNEFDAFLDNGTMPKKAGKVLLTFDDGFSDHYEYVYSELIKRNLWGIFYVPALPYITGDMLDVHRIQLLCGSVYGEDLFNETMSIVYDDMMPDSTIYEFRNNTYSNQKNARGILEVKRILNYFIDYAHRSDVIDKLCNKFSVDCSAQKFYLSKEQIFNMDIHGMLIGSHTVNHPVMSKLSYVQQEFEIVSSLCFLSSFLNLRRRTYCHPHGGFHSFNDDTVDILQKHGIDFSVNVESREIISDDFVRSRQHLPRFDCNEFPFGTAS